jgi:phosphate transport system substrate-binding protein
MNLKTLSRPQMRLRSILSSVALLGLVLLLAACGSNTGGNGPTTGAGTPTLVPCPNTTSLTGAGSTFVNPLFSKMFTEYANAKCGIQVNYQSVGSGAGITQLLNQTVDFGATDSPMTDAQLSQSKQGNVLHIPVTIGAVAVSYNLSSLTTPKHLNLDGTTLANIFLGKITNWNDPAIAADNPGVTLPNQTITVVHRSDGSGTTGIFTHYLSAVSPDWQSGPGAATTINWPVGVGASGNAGVATAVQQTAGAIGYNELAYVLTNNIQYADIKDHDGDYVEPSLDSAKAAAASIAASSIPADLRFFFVNSPGKNAYPITGFSWALVYATQSDNDKGAAIAQTMWWIIHTGQTYATGLNYVPLPDNFVKLGEDQIKKVMCGSSPCFTGPAQ